MQDDVPAADQFGQFGTLFRHAPAAVYRLHGGNAGKVVAVVFGQEVGRGQGFAQVVQRGGVAGGQAEVHVGGAL